MALSFLISFQLMTAPLAFANTAATMDSSLKTASPLQTSTNERLRPLLRLQDVTWPTSFQIIKSQIRNLSSMQDFRYQISKANPFYRDLIRVDCDRNANPIVRKYLFDPHADLTTQPQAESYRLNPGSMRKCEDIIQSIPSSPLTPDQILTSTSLLAGQFTVSALSDALPFDQMDLDRMQEINRVFYGPQYESGTFSFHHGHKTDLVYVYIPGFSEDASVYHSSAVRTFQRGHNVLIGTLPGFANSSWDISQIHPGHWLLYGEYLVRLAHSYGRKVIVVGNSSGANIAARTAELGIADGLVLIQPFFGLGIFSRWAVELGPYVPPSWLNFIGNQLGLSDMADTRPIFSKMEYLVQVSFRPGYRLKIPVIAIIANHDGIVSSQESLRWVQEKAPLARIFRHDEGHLFKPSDRVPEVWNEMMGFSFAP